MVWERSAVRNFLKKYSRYTRSTPVSYFECMSDISRSIYAKRGNICGEPIVAERYSKFTEQTGNKNAKKGKFQDAADLLSEGAGTDILLSDKVLALLKGLPVK